MRSLPLSKTLALGLAVAVTCAAAFGFAQDAPKRSSVAERREPPGQTPAKDAPAVDAETVYARALETAKQQSKRLLIHIGAPG